MPEQATVLLVEDEIFTRRMMQIYFENDGYHVEQASNATEALACLESKVIDIVLSDIMMPEISGLELLQKIRERYSKESLPVIMVTGLDDSKQILQAMAFGANDFMTKTKEFRIVLARVALHLEWKRLKHNSSQTGQIQFSSEPNQGAWFWNLKGGDVHFSARWKSLLGFEGPQIESRIDEWFRRIHPDDFDRVSKALGDAQNRVTASFEEVYRIQAANLAYIWVRTFGVVVFAGDNQPQYMAGSLSRLQSDEGLVEKRSALEKQLQEFAAVLDKLSGDMQPKAEAAKASFEAKAAVLRETLATLNGSTD